MSLDFDHEAERRILRWDSAEVYERLADISTKPDPGNDNWRCLGSDFVIGGEDLDFVPDAYFYFLDGDFLVWGAYWIDRFDRDNAAIAWIDRIRAPFPLPFHF